MNIVTVKYIFETSDKKAYPILKQIIDENQSVVAVGKENAIKLKTSKTNLGVNDFYSSRTDELVSAKENVGGFIEIVNKINPDENKRSQFDVDIIITEVKTIQANPDKNIDEDYDVIKGWIFNYKKEIFPAEFAVRKPEGMAYYESLNASAKEPVFTRVKGNVKSLTTLTTKEYESAFGSPEIREFKNTSKEWVVTWGAPEVYPLGDEENGITGVEYKTALENREVYLAEIKREQEERKAQKETSAFGGNVAPASVNNFNF